MEKRISSRKKMIALRELLDKRFQEIDSIILSRQDPITGLLPASTAKTAHGDYTDAWVRDNVYSILPVWGLGIAYRRLDVEDGRAYMLEQSVVKLMRGLLMAMMKQAHKVELFKHSQNPIDALHAKYDTHSGESVVGDHEWGHLQLDATSIFLLFLAQMTASGLRIIYTQDEVDFVQNLVHYIARAYRTPDYGIWERGNKINKGIIELNSSSVGMAKAALEAMSGFNLFGVEGGRSSVIHVLQDSIARARIVLEGMLPRESDSKEVDAALLSVVGFPAFAVEDLQLVEKTMRVIVDKLEGRYGCKRFLLDGHQTVLEDVTRLHYEAHELKQFEHVESEWPLFFTYLILNHEFLGNDTLADAYRDKLEGLFIERDGQKLLPELYFVPEHSIEAERKTPHSQSRFPNENVPLVWAQSLYLLGAMIQDGLLTHTDIDPLGRHMRIGRSRERPVQVAVLAENHVVQDYLEVRGIIAETLEQVSPIEVREADELVAAYTQLGSNAKLGLGGRPPRRLRPLDTSLVYEMGEQKMVFLPQFLNKDDFYLFLDDNLLAEKLRSELAYIRRHWDRPGQPLVTFLVTEDMLTEDSAGVLLKLIRQIESGDVGGVQVRSGPLRQLLAVTGRERMDYLNDFCFLKPSLRSGVERDYVLPFDPEASHMPDFALRMHWIRNEDTLTLTQELLQSNNIYKQIELLQHLHVLLKGDLDQILPGCDNHAHTLRNLAEEVYVRASRQRIWCIIRRAMDILGHNDAGLEDAVSEILIRQKYIAIGRAYNSRATIRQPISNDEVMAMIREFCNQDERERVLTQELVLYLSMIIKSKPKYFRDMLTLRISHLLSLIVGQVARENDRRPDEALDLLMLQPPSAIQRRLLDVISNYHDQKDNLIRLESLHWSGEAGGSLVRIQFPDDWDQSDLGAAQNWREWRQVHGIITRMPADFYSSVWLVMKHCKGLIIGDRYNRANCLESETLLSETTSGEKAFALAVEHLLNKVEPPEYRQLHIESLQALNEIFKANASHSLNDYLVLDVLIGHAVHLRWKALYPEMSYNDNRVRAWDEFYQLAPNQVANTIEDAMAYLLEVGSGAALTEAEAHALGQEEH